jgi:putative FmdB family regulatory protein
MPVYEYECQACHREFEYQQRMSDPEKTVCEACGGSLERLISRTAFQLKGGGWYKDLYASTKPEGAKAETKPADGAAAPAASTGESASTSAKADSGSSPGGGSSSSSGSSSGGGSTTGSGSSTGSGSTTGSGSSTKAASGAS